VSITDTILGPLTSIAASNGCTTLAGNNGSCTFTVQHTLTAQDADPLVNVVSVDYVAGDIHVTDSATATVDIIHPNFTVTKTCTTNPIPIGGPATFQVVVTNTGDVPLSFTTNEAANSSLPEPFTIVGGSNASQTLTITILATGTVAVPNTIQVTATLVDEPECVQFNTGNVKTAQDSCPPTPVGGATRTWGFWKTHTLFTECVFDKCGSSFDLGWRQVTNYEELFGIFMANNAKNADGSARCALGKARVTASHQALAALLNTCLENGKPLPAGITPCSIKNTLKCGTVAQINALNSKLDAYNNSGDTVKLSVDESCVQGSATPKDSLAAADETFADTTGGSDCTASSDCPACP
jgi:archaellum component FlaG (FlaF/FlaG flagellin family)